MNIPYELSTGVDGRGGEWGCMVFGRRAGIYAAEYVKKAKKRVKLSLEHVKKYVNMLKKAGIKPERKAPILLPDYRGKAVLARMIDVF